MWILYVYEVNEYLIGFLWFFCFVMHNKTRVDMMAI